MNRFLFLTAIAMTSLAAAAPDLPGLGKDGYLLPNGWRITPIGTVVNTEDLPLQITPAPDGKVVVAVTGGFNPHGLVVIDAKTDAAVQRIPLPTAWYGMAWRPDGARLYVSGGNNKSNKGIRAPIYAFDYKDGKLSDSPVAEMTLDSDPKDIYWAGLVHHPSKNLLFATNRTAHRVVVFDTSTGKAVTAIPVEVNPYSLVLTPDAKTLYCSNWASATVSVVNTETLSVTGTISVGRNPNDMLLSPDGRLFVCCANDNCVNVIDTAKGRMTETIITSLYAQAPEGSTPNALALDSSGKTLYVANADNNNVCVIEVKEPGESTVLGFLPAGWYPSALAVDKDGQKLYVGNAKGVASSGNIRGPNSPLPRGDEGKGSVKSLMKGSINIVDIPKHRPNLRALTLQVRANCPYNDDLLSMAKAPSAGPSVVPQKVGAASAIKHILYIIKENRTYDQVLGDMPKGNGDPRLTIFGKEVTPNHHAIAEQFVLLDNLYCDAEVSVDGHQWSNAAYATDFIEKTWPASYGGKSNSPSTQAMVPASGYMWDLCARKGLTYRSYGEFAARVSEKAPMAPEDPLISGLFKHVAPTYLCWDARDTQNAAEFIKEFDEYERNYDSPDPMKHLPSFMVVSLPEDHTRGASPGAPTPRAMVANNDYALGMIVDRLSHSKYWSEMAIFCIEDDAQDGSDHVDARRTIGFVVSPYCRRGIVDGTLYTTSSMLRTMELLLGLQPMSQYDAAATPMYASLSDKADLTPYAHLKPLIDVDEKNKATAWGAEDSVRMDFSNYDRAPMFALNEIIWKSVKGADSEMPTPIHRFQFAAATSGQHRK